MGWPRRGDPRRGRRHDPGRSEALAWSCAGHRDDPLGRDRYRGRQERHLDGRGHRRAVWRRPPGTEHCGAPSHVPRHLRDTLRQAAGDPAHCVLHGGERHGQAQHRLESGARCWPDRERSQGSAGAVVRVRRLSQEPQCAGRTPEGGGGAQAARHSRCAGARARPSDPGWRRAAGGGQGEPDEDFRGRSSGAGLRLRAPDQPVPAGALVRRHLRARQPRLAEPRTGHGRRPRRHGRRGAAVAVTHGRKHASGPGGGPVAPGREVLAARGDGQAARRASEALAQALAARK